MNDEVKRRGYEEEVESTRWLSGEVVEIFERQRGCPVPHYACRCVANFKAEAAKEHEHWHSVVHDRDVAYQKEIEQLKAERDEARKSAIQWEEWFWEQKRARVATNAKLTALKEGLTEIRDKPMRPTFASRKAATLLKVLGNDDAAGH